MTDRPKGVPKPRPINDGRLAVRTAMFLKITQGRGKPMTYGMAKK